MSDEQNPDIKDILEKLMKGGGDGDEPFIMVGGEDGLDLPEPEPQEAPEMLKEGQEVVIAGDLQDGTKISVEGVICGVAPLVGPFGPMGFDYVVRVTNPEVLPATEDGKPYPYSCVTAPPHLVTKAGDESTTDEAAEG